MCFRTGQEYQHNFAGLEAQFQELGSQYESKCQEVLQSEQQNRDLREQLRKALVGISDVSAPLLACFGAICC